MRKILHIFAVTIVIVFSLLPKVHASDKNIVLRAHDGDFIIEGKLMGYDETYYIIKSIRYGVMTVDVSKFTCLGPDCPKSKAQVSANSFSPQKIDFGIHGSNTIGASLMPSLLEGYAKKSNLLFEKSTGAKKNEIQLSISRQDGQQVASIDLKRHGSSSSFTSLADGVAQIGMSSRPAKDYEIDPFRTAADKKTLKKQVVALDAILIITAPSNPIKSLTLEQLAQIFSGEINNWSELGGLDKKINIYSRDDKSGTYETFSSLILKRHSKRLHASAKIFESNSELSDAVATDPDGIGFVGFAYEKNAKAIAIAKKCGIQTPPTVFNVKTQEYPLTRDLYLYSTNKTQHPVAKGLLKFAASKGADSIISNSGFISRSVDFMSFDELGEKIIRGFNKPEGDEDVTLLKDFVTTFRSARRLTTTFRFKPNSVFLDASSVDHIKPLGDIIYKAQAQNSAIYLVGFSDSVGDFEQNRQIALLRAQQVKNTILEAYGQLVDADRLIVKSYGELLPIDCNTTSAGRSNNRRVEIWLPKS